MTAPPDDRHLTTAALYEHWNAGAAIAIPLHGEPELLLRIDAPRQRLTLRAPVSPHVSAPHNDLAHVVVEVVTQSGGRFVEISTTDERLLADGYAMLSAIADRVQLDGVEPLAALHETLATWRVILATRIRMSTEAEVGLFGELLVLESLLASGGLDATAWRGGLSEEHDFGFAQADLEVKTTTGERRQHWIHGLNQMVPTCRTPLWIISTQLTRGGQRQGRTLPVLIDVVLGLVSDGTAGSHVGHVLKEAGWRPEQADLFRDPWRLRQKPLALRVDGAFPRLTPEQLTAGGVDVGAIRRVSYEIDVTDRPASVPVPSVISTIIHQMVALA